MPRPGWTSDIKPFTFRREAKWLLVLAVGLPAVGIFLAIVWPVMARWFAAR